MDDKIVAFCALLRQNGLRVSVSETMDALRALGLVGLEDRATVRAALRATAVKRAVDVETFDRLFDLFFSGMSQAIEEITNADAERDGAGPRGVPEDARGPGEVPRGAGDRALAAGAGAPRADRGRLEQLLREAAERGQLGDIQHGFQEGKFTHAMAQALGLGALTGEMEGLKGSLGGLDPETGKRFGAFLDRRLQDLADMLKAAVRQELDRQDVDRRDRQGMQALAEKSFFYLTEDEMRRMHEAVQKLARRLKNVVTIRRKRARRGRFDSSRTLRANLQFGGVPFRMFFDRKRKDKPQVIVLCDVSDSVRNVSRFMLQFVYALQDLYSKVRSFIFVADVGEVTKLFTDHDANTALDTALTGNVINVYAHSDFGRAFRSFHREFLSAVNNRTTVIVLGDARNNYNLPHEWALKDVQLARSR
jgi:uncharacterized protein with von Willebrand factor type A (vWA) domain